MAEFIYDHPEQVNTPDRLRYVIKSLMYDSVIHYKFVAKSGDSKDFTKGMTIALCTKVSVSNYGEPFELKLTHGKHEVTDTLPNGAYSYKFVPMEDPEVYLWENVPSEIVEDIVKKVSHYAETSLLECIDLIGDTISEHEADPNWYFDIPDHRMFVKTGEIPYIERSDFSYNNTDLKGHTVEIYIDSRDGITVFEDGGSVVSDVSPKELADWKHKAEQYDKLIDTLRDSLGKYL